LRIERELEVAQRFVGDDAGDVVLVGKEHRLGRRNAQLGGQRRAEELVVRRPHEGVVDDRASLEHRLLEVRTVHRHLVRDAVDEDVVRHRPIMVVAAKLGILGHHPRIPLVDLLDERRRPRPLPPDDQSDALLLHDPWC
jgi:hypothetical protein